ncbi:hypothetical protein [Planktothricoides sp. SR001]|uniref:hypothetical protein n=1 Tax=Planktothricoides sp. SR001 TaxID=1705388 RepID=UPI0012E1B226|nr:hypothetical protein [Planktothricoides sp. SR001]
MKSASNLRIDYRLVIGDRPSLISLISPIFAFLDGWVRILGGAIAHSVTTGLDIIPQHPRSSSPWLEIV